MRKVVSGEELKNKMSEAINLLCDTVKCTLGPKGNNVIIDHSSFSPFITNDGVTIAESIQSDDTIVNVILEIAKEASMKTNQNVGDGTTTTLVILQSIFNSCLKCIDSGVSPIVLKRELDEYLKKVILMLENERIDVRDDMIESISNISSNDKEISRVLSEVFFKVPVKEGITISEVDVEKVDVKYYKGYMFQSILASSLLLLDKSSINYQDSLLLIVDDVLDDLECSSSILNEVMKNKKPLIIVASDFSDYFVNNIVSYVLNNELKCVLLKVNEYGVRLRSVERDLAVISGAKIVNRESDISVHSLGMVKSIYVTKEQARIDFNSNKDIKNYIANIRSELEEINDEYDREFYNKRLSMFEGCSANIIIGANTKIELRERRMRLDDALCSVYSSGNGVLIGGGLSLLKISKNITAVNEVENIWKGALEMPFRQLMLNSGLDYKSVMSQIEETKFKKVYNIYKEEFESVENSSVLDSYEVIVNSIINACSIATMLITTNSLVINEELNNLNKNNDYGNI